MIRSNRMEEGSRAAGLAMLEAVLVLALLLAMLLSGLALADMMARASGVHRMVDQHLYDGVIRPWQVRTAEIGGGMELEVNEAALTEWIAGVAVKVEEDLTARAVEADEYFVESAWARIPVDPLHGGVDPAGMEVVQMVRGHFVPPATVLVRSDLEEEFRRLAGSSEASGGAPSFLALPSGRFGRDDAGQYLPVAFVVGLRVVRSVERGMTGAVLRELGVEPVVYDWRAIVLRGEFQM